MPVVTPPEAPVNYLTITPSDASETLLNLDVNEIRSLYEQYGAILFRGFDCDSETFSTMTEQYLERSVRNESGGREVVHQDTMVQTVNKGFDVFPLHPEIAREPWKPDMCFFNCEIPPTQGGETVICDGVEVVKRLPADLVEALKQQRLRYVLIASPEELEYWLGNANPTQEDINNTPLDCPFDFYIQPEGIIRTFTAPFLHKPMFHDDVAFGSFLLFSWYYNQQRNYPIFANGQLIPEQVVEIIKTVSDSIAQPIDWQTGDVVMLDNTRFMHGRNKIVEQDDRRILSRFGYIKSPQYQNELEEYMPWRTGRDEEFVKR